MFLVFFFLKSRVVFPGDPRKEDSLHHFKKSGMNTYEQTISKICTILSEYDSDQQYLVYGFGAKMDRELSHCFPLGKETEAEGVEGILAVYKQVFKTGIVMSKPTNFTEVIRTAAQDARTSWVRYKGRISWTVVAKQKDMDLSSHHNSISIVLRSWPGRVVVKNSPY